MTETVAKAKRHTVYKLKDGTRVPGVTTVLNELAKPALVKWANRIGLEGFEVGSYVDELATIGKLAHSMIEDHLAGKEISEVLYPGNSREQFDKASNSFLKYLAWEKQHEIKVVETELMVLSEEHRFGGTTDALLWIDGVLTIGDWKTGRAIYDDYFFQVSAYATAAYEMGHDVQAVRILQVGRNEEEGFSERVIPAGELRPYWDVFKAALGVYEAKKKIGRIY